MGTAALEIIEALPDVDVMLLPLGGGSGISGACIVAKAIDPAIQVYAVQSEAAPAAYLSWRQGEIVHAPMDTFAEGIATKSGYELPQSIMAGLLDDFLLVTDDDIRRAIGLLVEKAHTLAEPAGATALAGAVAHADRLRGKKVAITISGANITARASGRSVKSVPAGIAQNVLRYPDTQRAVHFHYTPPGNPAALAHRRPRLP